MRHLHRLCSSPVSEIAENALPSGVLAVGEVPSTKLSDQSRGCGGVLVFNGFGSNRPKERWLFSLCQSVGSFAALAMSKN